MKKLVIFLAVFMDLVMFAALLAGTFYKKDELPFELF